jgi:hypothetical protein
MPTGFHQPIIGRRSQGESATILRPPWPWPIRRFGLGPEDWESEGYESYYGLEFETELHFPCDGVCDFIRGCDWSIAGSLSADVEVAQRTSPGAYDNQTYSISESLPEDLTVPLGQSASYTDDPVFGFESFFSGTSWDELNSIYELSPPDNAGQLIASIDYRKTLDITYSSPHTSDFQLIFGAFAGVHLPEIGPNENGELVWRIKVTGSIYISTIDNELPPLAFVYILNESEVQDKGIEFVDEINPANSKIITPSESGFSLTLTRSASSPP